MPFLELSLRCRAADESWLEQALNDVGALAVTLMDADAATPNERAVLEPGVGEQPLWAECVVTALFPAGTPQDGLLAALESIDPRVALDTAEFRDVEDQDWERAWMDQYAPMRFGTRTWIVPWNHELPDEAGTDAAVVRLDPGLAFGSGTHPTTSLCLQWLDGLDLREQAVLDVGCGSGILALAALKLGAARAVGVDNDPQALLATHDNAERNAVGDRAAAFLRQAEPATATYRVVVANILASALDALAGMLAARVAPGGRIALSGILAGQEDELLERYGAWFDALAVAREGDWMRIDGVRTSS